MNFEELQDLLETKDLKKEKIVPEAKTELLHTTTIIPSPYVNPWIKGQRISDYELDRYTISNLDKKTILQACLNWLEHECIRKQISSNEFERIMYDLKIFMNDFIKKYHSIVSFNENYITINYIRTPTGYELDIMFKNILIGSVQIRL